MSRGSAAQEGTTPNPAYSEAQAEGAAVAGVAGGREWCEGGELVAVSDLKFSRVIGEVGRMLRLVVLLGACHSHPGVLKLWMSAPDHL